MLEEGTCIESAFFSSCDKLTSATHTAVADLSRLSSCMVLVLWRRVPNPMGTVSSLCSSLLLAYLKCCVCAVQFATRSTGAPVVGGAVAFDRFSKPNGNSTSFEPLFLQIS